MSTNATLSVIYCRCGRANAAQKALPNDNISFFCTACGHSLDHQAGDVRQISVATAPSLSLRDIKVSRGDAHPVHYPTPIDSETVYQRPAPLDAFSQRSLLIAKRSVTLRTSRFSVSGATFLYDPNKGECHVPHDAEHPSRADHLRWRLRPRTAR
jgi:hypothetical protein